MFIPELVVIGLSLQYPRPFLIILGAQYIITLLIPRSMDARQIKQQMGQSVCHVATVTRSHYLLVYFRMVLDIGMGTIYPERHLKLIMGQRPIYLGRWLRQMKPRFSS